MATKHESEYVDYEPPPDEEKPTLPEDARQLIVEAFENAVPLLYLVGDILSCHGAVGVAPPMVGSAGSGVAEAASAPPCAPPSAAATPPLPIPPFTLGFEDLAYVHTSIRQLVSAMGIKDDEERSIVSRAAYAIKKYFPDHTSRGALEELGGVTDLAARGAILRLVDTMRDFTLRNSDHVRIHLKEKDQAGPSAFSLLLRLLSTHLDNGDQGRAFEKLQAFAGTMQHNVLLGRDSWMRFAQRTYTILPRQPSQPIFGELSLSAPLTEGLSTFLSDNQPTTDTFHLEFAGVHAISLSSTPTLVPVNFVHSLDIPALTGHYLVYMLPRDGVSSETEILVANGYQTIPPSGSTKLEPGDLLGTSSSPLIKISTSALQDTTTEPLPTDIHALHDIIPGATDGSPQTEPPPPRKVPCPKLVERLSGDQRTSFLPLWDQLPLHLRDIRFDLHGSGWSLSVIEDLGHVLCEFPDVFSTSKPDFGSCSLIPFKIFIPPDSAPVFSRLYLITSILAKKANAVLDQYLAAGLIQHSTSPYASPMVAIPK
eukprot:jgi/Undpi1/7353/HiC_scaffold_22.g09826.m1